MGFSGWRRGVGIFSWVIDEGLAVLSAGEVALLFFTWRRFVVRRAKAESKKHGEFGGEWGKG
jgi:hypothetical protein